jgi:hypothetical protein
MRRARIGPQRTRCTSGASRRGLSTQKGHPTTHLPPGELGDEELGMRLHQVLLKQSQSRPMPFHHLGTPPLDHEILEVQLDRTVNHRGRKGGVHRERGNRPSYVSSSWRCAWDSVRCAVRLVVRIPDGYRLLFRVPGPVSTSPTAASARRQVQSIAVGGPDDSGNQFKTCQRFLRSLQWLNGLPAFCLSGRYLGYPLWSDHHPLDFEEQGRFDSVDESGDLALTPGVREHGGPLVYRKARYWS